MNREDFVSFHQKYSFQEVKNLFDLSNKSRDLLVHYYEGSLQLNENELMRDMLSKNMQDYCQSIDDQGGINNFADQIRAATSNTTLKSHQWKSSLREDNVAGPEEHCSCKVQLESNFFLLPESTAPIPNDISADKTEVAQLKVNKTKLITNNSMPCSSSKPPELNFKTAKEELREQQLKRNHGNCQPSGKTFLKKSLGTKRAVQNKFTPPFAKDGSECFPKSSSESSPTSSQDTPELSDERLRNIEPRMVELILSEIIDRGPAVNWEDVAGLEPAKAIIKEIVVWPLLRPDIFTGLRRPPKGVLLFGPPGTGKTLIGKCVASQSRSTFFSISASSLTSKWIGEGEKMVRALFAVARCHQPAVVFIDEVDSLLCQRSETEHESSRRLKTEFLVQLDGASTADDDRILVIGATNRPQELDEAARRRFVKRLYIPLPCLEARYQIIRNLFRQEKHCLSEEDMKEIAAQTDGYSGADMKNLCAEASLEPVRSIDISAICSVHPDQVRGVTKKDFDTALIRVKASVSPSDLEQYETWNSTFGFGHI